MHSACSSDFRHGDKLCSDPDKTQPCSCSFEGRIDLTCSDLYHYCWLVVNSYLPPWRLHTALVCAVLSHTRILSANIVDFITTLYSNHTNAVVKAPLRSGRHQTAAAHENTTRHLSVPHRVLGSTCGQPSPQSTQRGELKVCCFLSLGSRATWVKWKKALCPIPTRWI